MAAKGYPDEPEHGQRDPRPSRPGGRRPQGRLHAGTRRDGGRLLAAGGRVLGVTALGQDLAAARDRAYTAVDRIDWPQGFCRRDIGLRATSLEPSPIPDGRENI